MHDMLGDARSDAADRPRNDLYERQVKLTRVLLVGLLATALLVIALNLVIVGPEALSFQGLTSLLAIAAVVAFALNRLSKGKLQQAVALSAGSLLLLLGYEVLEGGVSASSSILLGFTIPITLAGLLLSRSALLVTSVVSILILIGVRTAERIGAPWVAIDPDLLNPDTQVIVFALMMGLLTLILDRFGGTLRFAYGAAVQRERELARLNQALQLQIEEREQAEAARDLSEGSLRLASEVVGGLGIWSWDVTKGTTTWSESLRNLLGVPKHTPSSAEAFMERVHPQDRASLEASLQDVHAIPGNRVREFRIVRPDGQVCWVESRYRAIQDADGRTEQMIGVLYDVSSHKSLEQELEKRVEMRTRQLTTANGELEAFTYSASHDLRAPLRGLDGFAQVLLDDYGEQLDENGLHYVKRIRAAAQRMGELIDCLLLLSQVTREKLRWETVDMTRLAQSVVQELRERSPEREISVDIAPDLVARGDEQLLRVVLENLIGNSWKFTIPRHQPIIEVGAQKQGEETIYFVQDNGVGFDMNYSDKLFTPFQRLHSDRFEGSGIGLATVQRIIQRHDGRIWAEGEPTKGASFYFALGTSQ